MTDKIKPSSNPSPNSKVARNKRLSDNLRANLRRRKAADRKTKSQTDSLD